MEEELDIFDEVKGSGSCGALVNLLLVFGFMGIDSFQDAQPPGRQMPFLLSANFAEHWPCWTWKTTVSKEHRSPAPGKAHILRKEPDHHKVLTDTCRVSRAPERRLAGIRTGADCRHLFQHGEPGEASLRKRCFSRTQGHLHFTKTAFFFFFLTNWRSEQPCIQQVYRSQHLLTSCL